MKKFYADNKFVPSTPKTYEVRYLENKEPSKLSKLASWLGMKTVDNCSYSNCPYPSVPFNLAISVDGQNRNWARNSNNDALPGNWAYSSHILGDYYWKGDIRLNRIDQARETVRYIDNDYLWVVNAAGLYCVENGKFCKNARHVVSECIYYHERGGTINEIKVIDSDLHKWAEWTVKTAAIAAATAANPLATAGIGAGTWLAAKGLEHRPGASESESKFFGSVSNFGGDAAKSGILGWAGGKADKFVEGLGLKNLPGNQKDFCGWGEVTDKTASKFSDYSSVKIAKEIGSSGMGSLAEHQYNRANGKNCDSGCPFCDD
jgi:hypothetical protein